MWFFAVFIAAFVIAYSLTPKPQSNPPAGLGDFDVPTAEDGREIPVLFGTCELKAPNAVWYGHLKTIAIRKKGGKK